MQLNPPTITISFCLRQVFVCVFLLKTHQVVHFARSKWTTPPEVIENDQAKIYLILLHRGIDKMVMTLSNSCKYRDKRRNNSCVLLLC